MKDSFSREIDYLRISVTDLCNLRCLYCMPEKGVAKIEHDKIISPERIKEIVTKCAELGIKKVRLTGGEPLVRKGIIEIIKSIRSVKGIEEICLTTNGLLLNEMAHDLFDAGVDRLNISLDTLDEKKFSFITRGGKLAQVISGIKKAQEVGFKNTKVNCVLIGGFNDDEIERFADFAKRYSLIVRFIELMPIGESEQFEDKSFVSNELILKRLPNLIPIDSDGVAMYYSIPHSNGIIGLISPLSNSFCASCSRIRLTSDGKIKPCLHSKDEIDLNGLTGEKLSDALKRAILSKPKQHSLNEDRRSKSIRGMSKIGG